MTGVTKLVIPGPFWATIMDILPEARVKPSAIMPALPSWATSQKVIPAFGKRSEIGMNAEPIMPKAYVFLVRFHHGILRVFAAKRGNGEKQARIVRFDFTVFYLREIRFFKIIEGFLEQRV